MLHLLKQPRRESEREREGRGGGESERTTREREEGERIHYPKDILAHHLKIQRFFCLIASYSFQL